MSPDWRSQPYHPFAWAGAPGPKLRRRNRHEPSPWAWQLHLLGAFHPKNWGDMGHRISGGLCVVLTAIGISPAMADVWIVHDRVLERRAVNGSLVTTVSAPFGTPIGTIIEAGEVDPSTGNIWLVSRELDRAGGVHVLGVSPSGEGLWELAQLTAHIAVDPVRHGLWVLGEVDSETVQTVLYDETTGDARATIRGVAGTGAVGTDGALWIGTATAWIRLQGTTEELDGYEVVGSTGPHHQTFQPGPHGNVAAVDRSDGSLYFGDIVSLPNDDILEGHLVKFSAEGEQLFRVRYGALHHIVRVLWDVITDIDVSARDGSVYLTTGSTFNFGGSVAHVSAMGADLGTVEYREYVNSVAVDPEDSGVWIGHMPVVDDGETLIAPMILRKLDPSSLQTDLSVPFESVVTVIGAAPAAFEISLDIETRDKRNVINLIPQKGEIRVALLSSATFDALQVDVDTIRFGTAGAVVRSYWTRDVNRDGYMDLVVTFRTAHTGIECGDTAAPLTAETHGGVDVHGTDFLQTRCKA